MRYEWDKSKNRANIARHGVDFADAVAVFEDPLALTRPDEGSRGEARCVTLGLDFLGRHLGLCGARCVHSNHLGPQGNPQGTERL